MALSNLISKTTSYELREFPTAIRTPGMFYAEHEDPNFNNAAVSYLPEELTPKNPKKSGLVGQFFQQPAQPSKSTAASKKKAAAAAAEATAAAEAAAAEAAAAGPSNGDNDKAAEDGENGDSNEEEEADLGRGGRRKRGRGAAEDGDAKPAAKKDRQEVNEEVISIISPLLFGMKNNA